MTKCKDVVIVIKRLAEGAAFLGRVRDSKGGDVGGFREALLANIGF